MSYNNGVIHFLHNLHRSNLLFFKDKVLCDNIIYIIVTYDINEDMKWKKVK